MRSSIRTHYGLLDRELAAATYTIVNDMTAGVTAQLEHAHRALAVLGCRHLTENPAPVVAAELLRRELFGPNHHTLDTGAGSRAIHRTVIRAVRDPREAETIRGLFAAVSLGVVAQANTLWAAMETVPASAVDVAVGEAMLAGYVHARRINLHVDELICAVVS